MLHWAYNLQQQLFFKENKKKLNFSLKNKQQFLSNIQIFFFVCFSSQVYQIKQKSDLICVCVCVLSAAQPTTNQKKQTNTKFSSMPQKKKYRTGKTSVKLPCFVEMAFCYHCYKLLKFETVLYLCCHFCLFCSCVVVSCLCVFYSHNLKIAHYFHNCFFDFTHKYDNKHKTRKKNTQSQKLTTDNTFKVNTKATCLRLHFCYCCY